MKNKFRYCDEFIETVKNKADSIYESWGEKTKEFIDRIAAGEEVALSDLENYFEGLVQLTFDDRFLLLFRRMCIAALPLYNETVIDFVRSYRESWGGRSDMEIQKLPLSPEEGKMLIKRYPFLLPRNRWTDQVPEDYDYTYTEIGALERGWLLAFGVEMLEELRSILDNVGGLEKYRIIQIKEKYGYLHWYAGCPKECAEEHERWLGKYEKLSFRTCIYCGKLATKVRMGYIIPLCDECAELKAPNATDDISVWIK